MNALRRNFGHLKQSHAYAFYIPALKKIIIINILNEILCNNHLLTKSNKNKIDTHII